MRVHSAHVCAYARPWPEAVRGRKGMRRGSILTLFDAEGRSAQGEVAPLPPFTLEDNDAATTALSEMVKAGSALYAMDFETLADVDAWVRSSSPLPTVRHGLEQALLGLIAGGHGLIPEVLFPERPLGYIVSHCLVSTPEEASEAVTRGIRTLKIKTSGLARDETVALVEAIRHTVGPQVQLRVDANQAWSMDEALGTLEALRPYALEFIEEPLVEPTPESLSELQAATGIRIACDESIRSPQDLERFLSEATLSVLVLKPMFIGGCLPALEMADRAIERGLKVLVTTSLDGDLAHAHASLCARLIRPDGLLPCGLSPSSSTLTQPPRERDATVPHPLVSASTARPEHTAWTMGEVRESYASLIRRVQNRASALAATGIRKGQRVVLTMGPQDHAILNFWALTWLGAVPVLIDAKARKEVSRHSLQALGAIPFPTSPLPENQGVWNAPAWRLDEERVVLFTSGSTGTARSVSLTTRQLLFSALGQAARLGHHLDDRWACALPLHHVGGLSILLRTAWLHTTAAIYTTWNPERVSQDIDDGRISMLSLVPTMLIDLLKARDDRPFPESLRVLLLGGARTPESLLERCRALKAPVALTWGMTEAASQVASNIPGDYQHALAPLATAVVTSDQSILTVTSPLVGGYFKTSDRGSVGEDGRVTIAGRVDDMIMSGGENISLLEITRSLLSHDKVTDAYVFGVKDDRWGERPWALVVGLPGEKSLTESSLRTYLASELAHYKTPDRFVFIERIPKNAMGKISMASIEALFDEPSNSCEPALPASSAGFPL
jgi:o-succinylbenzoate---CoA ligase